MRKIIVHKGLDVPIGGRPALTVENGAPVEHVALLGDDYVGMKPTMHVEVGDRVSRGQCLFADKKNDGVVFTSPGCGEVVSINRGAKRRFESLVIRLEGEEAIEFCRPGSTAQDFTAAELRRLLVDSGLWCSLRTRPYGKIPPVAAAPASLFVTAIDTSPLGPDVPFVIGLNPDDFRLGLQALCRLVETTCYLCVGTDETVAGTDVDGVEPVRFEGPHPAGLPSTHIHFLDPVHEGKTVWHIDAQDVTAIGGLLRTGRLPVERIVALGGPSVRKPRHLRTRLGASVLELCDKELKPGDARLLSGSILTGRTVDEQRGFLGRYHQQISCLPEGTGRELFGWFRPGGNRFSVTRSFLSAFIEPRDYLIDTAVRGGHRAIFPLGSYEKVMPLDIVPIYLLKSLASGNTQKAKELGCLELVEEDLALCTVVCPGKNEFGPMLRETLTTIELEG